MTWSEVADHLVGVVDLQRGLAVHGVAGNRQMYRPVAVSRFRIGGRDGDPLELVDHYRDQGVRRFYVADLDALANAPAQTDCLENLLAARVGGNEHWIIDVGLNERIDGPFLRWFRKMTTQNPGGIRWVVASESAMSLQTPGELAKRIDPASLLLGIDFRDGHFIGPKSVGNAEAIDVWVRNADLAGISGALLLDVASVGMRAGPATTTQCRGLRAQKPAWRLISGGGCRNSDDVAAFVEAGCDECLVATAMQR